MTQEQADILSRASLDQIFSYLLDRLEVYGKDAHKSVSERPRYLASYCEAMIAVPLGSISDGALTPEQLRYVLVRALHFVQLYLLGRRKHNADFAVKTLMDRERARREQDEVGA